MFYDKSNSIGIRRKFGDKKQCFSFGGKRVQQKEAALRGFADDCLRKLDAGMSERQVQDWARECLTPL